MAESAVSRCVAVAAHGKRCQQTPFRGSPYCWHHTQSRKIWAPSRVRSAPPRPAPVEQAEVEELLAPGRRVRHVAPVPEPTPEENLSAVVWALAERLEPRDFAEIVHFLVNVDTGSLLLVKGDGDLVDVRLERMRSPRPRPARGGRPG
jgi:hypothetical protein